MSVAETAVVEIPPGMEVGKLIRLMRCLTVVHKKDVFDARSGVG